MNISILSCRITCFIAEMRDKDRAAHRTTPSPNLVQILAWCVVVLAMVFISIRDFHLFQIGVTRDDVQYVILAQSLISSDTYGMVNEPGHVSPGKYPFGYPLFLSIALRLFPGNLDALKAVSLIATVLNAILLFFGWRWFFPRRSHWWGLAITALYALSPMIIEQTRMVMSEPVFLFFCLLALLLVIQCVHRNCPAAWSIILGVSLVLAAYTRSNGFVLVGVVFVYLVVVLGRDAWRKIAQISASMVMVLFAVVFITPVQASDLIPFEYFKDPNASWLNRILKPASASIESKTAQAASPVIDVSPTPTAGQTPENGKPSNFVKLLIFDIQQHFGKDLRWIALPFGGGVREEKFAQSIGFPALPMIFGYAVSALIVMGLILLLRENPLSPFLWFAVFFFGLLMLWIWIYPRLLYPIQPQIQLCFLAALEAIFVLVTRPFQKRWPNIPLQKILICSLFTVLVLISFARSSLIEDTRTYTGDFQQRTLWLSKNTDPGYILMSEMPEVDYVYSQRSMVGYPQVKNASELWDYIKARQVGYILIAPRNSWLTQYNGDFTDWTKIMIPMLEQLANDGQIHLIHASDQDRIRVYQVEQ